MSIIVVEEPGSGACSIDQYYQRTYQRIFRVTLDSAYKRGGSARTATGIPTLGSHYVVFAADGTTVVEEDTGSFVRGIASSYSGGDDNDGLDWTVTVDYGPYDASTFTANPIDHPLRVSWGSAKYEKVCEKDQDDDPILNSAGDSFDPPVAIDDSRTVLRVVKNLATFDPATAHDFKDSINDATWEGYPAYAWKVEDITAELKYNGECGWYNEVTFELSLNPDLWRRKVLDQGLRKLVSGNQVNIKDNNGEDVTSPVLLDGSGGVLASGGTPTFLEFKVYKERDFSGLGLDFTGAPGWGG